MTPARTPTLPAEQERPGTQMNFPQAPGYVPLPSEILAWAMQHAHTTPTLKLVVEMALIASHLLASAASHPRDCGSICVVLRLQSDHQ
eukprot:3965848-Amphidinium_carterae.1